METFNLFKQGSIPEEALLMLLANCGDITL